MAQRLSDDQRKQLAEKIMDWGNLVFVGLTITQAFESVPYALGRVIVGLVVIAGAYGFALMLTKGGDD
jgi:hypothetical protein